MPGNVLGTGRRQRTKDTLTKLVQKCQIAFPKKGDAERSKGKLRAFQNLTLNNLESYIQVTDP